MWTVLRLRALRAQRVAAIGLLTAGLSLCGCASAPPETPQQLEADERMAGEIYAALEADRMHLYIGLNVRVRAGVAYINGLTFDPAVRDQATEIARSVPGVISVRNQMDVRAGSGP